MDSQRTERDFCPAGLLCGDSLPLHLPQAQVKGVPEQMDRILEEREEDRLDQYPQMETV